MRKVIHVDKIKVGVIAVEMWVQLLDVGVSAVQSPVNKTYEVTHIKNNDFIILKGKNVDDMITVDIDYLYERFYLFNSETEYLLFNET